jgi:glycosyltransferase involved in cell wall biosynthesis
VTPLAILHVDPERGLGGGERQVLGLIRHLAAAGHRQAVAGDARGRLLPAAEALGAAGRALGVRNHLDVLAGRRLASLLARERYDIVHFHTARAHALAAFLGRSTPTRRVVTRRMDYPLRGGWYARWLYNRAVDAVVAISEGVRAVLVSGGVDPGRVRVIRSGVEVDDFIVDEPARSAARAAFGIGAGELVLAAVAALEERKGHAVLFDAVARLGELPLRVLCAGEGAARATLAARVSALGLDRRVTFLGTLADVRPVLAAADLVVMPSLYEGLGVAALEGMAAGRPVVASRVGGLPEAIGDDVGGVLVPPGDPAALARAIARLARDPDLARRLGAGGRARVGAEFSMARMAAATAAVYRELCMRGSMAGDDGRIASAS